MTRLDAMKLISWPSVVAWVACAAATWVILMHGLVHGAAWDLLAIGIPISLFVGEMALFAQINRIVEDEEPAV